ncbi:hypothetical protein RchiOBHm_Chr2g0139521 [Rosa chinensis]|uniref:Uncharacterized protein n=1 Tax=Rosa chinensis TaxID=74649 RepID=A0A2P6RX66_ROSCH|nr:uncharacterized protein LOC112187534 isoform X2 [Rosa chinensis]PRQ51006.1 hypothetical protein RchiOBHm_Chr2g0139521 [Rosa chinensis]
MDQTDLNQKVRSLHSPNSMNLRDVYRSWNGTNSSRKGLDLGLLFCTETISIYNSQPQHLSHSRSLHRYLKFLLTDIRLPSQSRSGKGRSSANTVYQIAHLFSLLSRSSAPQSLVCFIAFSS